MATGRVTDLGTYRVVPLDTLMEAAQAAHDDAMDPRVNPCPECPEGEVVNAGGASPETIRPVCSAACGWEA